MGLGKQQPPSQEMTMRKEENPSDGMKGNRRTRKGNRNAAGNKQAQEGEKQKREENKGSGNLGREGKGEPIVSL